MRKKFAVLFVLVILFFVFSAVVASAEEWLWPTEVSRMNTTWITQRYKSSHLAIDIGGEHGSSPIYASKSGKVVARYDGCNCRSEGRGPCSDNSRELGNYVIIDHGNGEYSRYIHLHYKNVATLNSQVNQGDIIGYMGSTGSSTGVHLDFRIYQGGTGIQTYSNGYGAYEQKVIGGSTVNTNPKNVYSDGNITYITEANLGSSVTSFDFWGVDDNITISGTYKFWWKQTGYGSCDVNLDINGNHLATIYPDDGGYFSYNFDSAKYANGTYTVGAIIRSTSGTEKYVTRTITINNPSLSTPSLSMKKDREHINIKTNITFNWSTAGSFTTGYNLYIAPLIEGTVDYDWNNARIYLPGYQTLSYTVTAGTLQPGAYAAYVQAWNMETNLKSEASNFIWFIVEKSVTTEISSNLVTPTLSYATTLDETNPITINWTLSGANVTGYNLYVAPLIEGTVDYNWSNAKIYLPGYQTSSYTLNVGYKPPGAYAAYIESWDRENALVSNKSNFIFFIINDISINISLDFNNEDSCVENLIVKYNELYGDLPTPQKEGYDFLGWYTEKEGGTLVTSKTKVTATADHTLYAQWEVSESCTKSTVTKIETTFSITSTVYNIDETATVIIAGYKNGRFVAMDCVPYNQEEITTTLTGDIDTIKVMVWSDLINQKPLCEEEIITSDEFITQ